jgi:hypothetical protein
MNKRIPVVEIQGKHRQLPHDFPAKASYSEAGAMRLRPALP